MSDEKRPEELAEVRQKGLAALHEPRSVPDAPPLREVKEALHVWRVTSFFDGRSWTAYQERSGSVRVRRVRWDQATDLARMTDPRSAAKHFCSTRPTLEVADAPFDAATVEQWLKSLGAISIAPVVTSGVQLDGDRWGLRTLGGSFSVEWGCEPKAWMPLISLVYEIADQLDLMFPEPG